MLIAAGAIFLLLYLNAGNIYSFHHTINKEKSILSKIISTDTKYLDNKEQWIKRYKIKMVLIFGLIMAILLFVSFGLWKNAA